MDHKGWKSKVIDITFPRSEGIGGVKNTIDRICSEAKEAINSGYSLAILSDRNIQLQGDMVSKSIEFLRKEGFHNL